MQMGLAQLINLLHFDLISQVTLILDSPEKLTEKKKKPKIISPETLNIAQGKWIQS
jgi:hypothetical protein